MRKLTRMILAFCISMLVLFACRQHDSLKPAWLKPDTDTISCESYFLLDTPNGMLFNNVWNKGAAKSFKWQECLEKSLHGDMYGWSWSWPTDSDTIYAYPQIKVGTSPWAPTPDNNSDFPLDYLVLDRLVISHQLDISGNSEHNVATSMWLTSTANIGNEPNSNAIVAELMIWSYSTDNHMNPAGRRQGDVEFDQQQWEVWVDKNWGDASGEHDNRWAYITFRAKKSALQATFDAMPLINYAIDHNILPQHFYIADIELGTEIMSGSGLVWVKSFDVSIEKKK